MRFLKSLCLTIITISSLIQLKVSGEKILVLTFYGSKSHKNVFEPLYYELARKGHDLTLVSPVKSGYTQKNMKEINGVTLEDVNNMDKSAPPLNIFNFRLKSKKIRTALNPFLIPMFERGCRSYFQMPEVKALVNQKFDLVIASSFMNECTYGLVHLLNTSYIFVHVHPLEHYKAEFTGLRFPPSFVPSYSVTATDSMTFMDRVTNFLTYQYLGVLYDWIYLPRMEAVYKEYLGTGLPSAREIERNASLVLNNAHFSLTFPTPLMPQIIDVAGMHCKPGKPLPKDLQDFAESSGSEGFIYFSLGSHVKPSTMPDSVKEALITAFSKLKQKVLWKWDLDSIEGLPQNVKLSKWVPQQDVLAHPKIRAFITHGGLLSTEESVYHGVPLIGIPLFGDQALPMTMEIFCFYDWNMRQAEHNGYAIPLELIELTADKILNAVNRILTEKKFTERVKTLSKQFKDRPETALETAVFWTEYVMRHKGAVHLRSPAADLNDFAYHSLDVIALIGGLLLLVAYLLLSLIRMCCCGKSKSDAGNKRKANAAKKRL